MGTSIGYGAFYDCKRLTSISLPDGLTSIGDRAFVYCSSLTSMSLPDGVTSIGVEAFLGCSSLTSIALPDGVTSIGGLAFEGCSSLTCIYGSSSVYDLAVGAGAHDAANDCTYIPSCKEVITAEDFPSGITEIPDYAFPM